MPYLQCVPILIPAFCIIYAMHRRLFRRVLFFYSSRKNTLQTFIRGRLLSPLLTRILFSSFNWFASVRSFFVEHSCFWLYQLERYKNSDFYQTDRMCLFQSHNLCVSFATKTMTEAVIPAYFCTILDLPLLSRMTLNSFLISQFFRSKGLTSFEWRFFAKRLHWSSPWLKAPLMLSILHSKFLIVFLRFLFSTAKWWFRYFIFCSIKSDKRNYIWHNSEEHTPYIGFWRSALFISFADQTARLFFLAYKWELLSINCIQSNERTGVHVTFPYAANVKWPFYADSRATLKHIFKVNFPHNTYLVE